MKPLILVTCATGYVGGELLKALLAAGHRVRCLARRPEALPAAAGAEVVRGDVLDSVSVRAAVAGVDTAYYLVHSMASTGSFEEEDRAAARAFGDAAREAGVRRIVYLGELGRSSQELSAHLRSRHEVGEILRSSGVPVIEFRASIVIGSGSLSFEMIRALVERLPVMIAPRWVSVLAQPIAISDLLDYLLAALDLAPGPGGAFEIGGASGWYCANWLWKLRGAIDPMVGGVGLRRCRRDPNQLRAGDVLDCWRAEVFEPNRRLRLAAKMKLPGRAWLEFEVSGDSSGTTIRQTATFDPAGVSGRIYWYAVHPLHQLVFDGMLRKIAAACDRSPAEQQRRRPGVY